MNKKEPINNKILPKKADVRLSLTPSSSDKVMNCFFVFSDKYKGLTVRLNDIFENLNSQNKIELEHLHDWGQTWFVVNFDDIKSLEPAFNEVSQHNVFKIKYLENTVAEGLIGYTPSNVGEIREIGQRIMNNPNGINKYLDL